MYLYGQVLSKKVNESGTGPEVYLDGRLMKWGNFIEFDGRYKATMCPESVGRVSGMTGRMVLKDDGIRKTIYKFSTYEGTDGQVKPWATFAVIDGGVVSSPVAVYSVRRSFRTRPLTSTTTASRRSGRGGVVSDRCQRLAAASTARDVRSTSSKPTRDGSSQRLFWGFA